MFKKFNIESRKVYNLIALSTIAFIVLSIQSFYYIGSELKNLAEQNRNLIIKEMRDATKLWLEKRVNILELTANYINANYTDEERIKNISQVYRQYDKYFDAMQILVLDNYFYVNGMKIEDYKKRTRYKINICQFNDDHNKNEEITKLCSEETGKAGFKDYNDEHWYLGAKWFQDTKRTMGVTMETMRIHGLLGEKTVNLCAPIKDDKGNFKGVFCGVVRTCSIPEKMEMLKIPENYYYFISDRAGNILTKVGDDELVDKNVREIFARGLIQNASVPQDIDINQSVVTIDKLIDFDWYIGVGVDKKALNSQAMWKFFKHSIIIFGCFALFIFVINGSYLLLYRHSEARRREYEKILQYRSKMSEIGELISVINHQIRQPINTLALIVDNILNRLNGKNYLNKNELEEYLQLFQKYILLIDKTIDTFRNFYSLNDTVTEFELKSCVESILHITHMELSLSSITATIDASNIEGLKIHSVENFIQQILLVLIQNAKEAIMPLKVIKELHRRKIEIKFEIDEKFVHILVSDFGEGITEETKKRLFLELKSSTKSKGVGMGLFFSKKLAKERLKGDLMLVNSKMPTTFKLTLLKDVKGNRQCTNQH
ncbi:MAG: sensor histidine kinase [Campylobacteraceae bacterium]|jgi:signal transduction histidine kinase|nr:sensor histidine kinase [Campylobacteraceae bacterium]